MTIALVPLAQLDPDLVGQALDELTARVQEDNPNLDLRRGVFADLLAYYNGLLAAQRMQNINDYLNARSLAALNANPAGADPSLVDDVLSNFLLARGAGAQAQGEVTVIVSDSTTVTIAQGSVWQANGQQFVTPETYTAKLEQAQINDSSDRLMTPVPQGWAFTVFLQAVNDGPAGNLAKDTLLVPLVLPSNFVTAYATSDFTGGTLPDTNAQFLNKMQTGIACKAPSNRPGMAAMLQEIQAFSQVTAMSIIGMGDPEMARDRHWIFPVSGGGRLDWYVRTQPQLYHLALTKTATLVAVDPSDGKGIWQFTLTRDDAPGFYEVAAIRPSGTTNFQGGYAVTQDTRTPDLTGTGFIPDVAAQSTEWVYSRFQTAAIQFKDTDTDVSSLPLLSTQSYDLEARCLPLIGQIQDTVSGRDVHAPGTDVLVKAPVPCFLSLNFAVNIRSGDPAPDTASMATALCDLVNGLGFVSGLYASQLQDVVYGFLKAGQTASRIDMFGRIRYPDGSAVYLRDYELLEVPSDPANLVTPRTVQFFLDPGDIGISVATAALGD